MRYNSLRMQFARQVATTCAFDARFADLFSIRDVAGRRVVVPVLETDSIQLAVALIQQGGGEGTVAVRVQGKDEYRPSVVFLRFSILAISPMHRHGECDLPVGPDCTVADLLKVLLPGVSLTMRMVEDGVDELQIADLGKGELPSDAADEFAFG
ncbi:MAG: hypothetical protein M3N28_05485 [Actinomycetota bacterium]|nr:hypothetical protein [Actinomycetota bacterium]